MRNRCRRPMTEAQAAISQAREALNVALDGLGATLPAPGQVIALMELASRAFGPGTAALKLAKLLFRVAATSKGERR